MTVRELIERLAKCDWDKEIMIDRGGAYNDAKSVDDSGEYVFISSDDEDEEPALCPEFSIDPQRGIEWRCTLIGGHEGKHVLAYARCGALEAKAGAERRCTRDAGHVGDHFWGSWVTR